MRGIYPAIELEVEDGQTDDDGLYDPGSFIHSKLVTYALAEHLDKGITELWPRADRQMYNAPKRLVEQGMATARKEPSDGSRERTGPRHP